MKESGDINELKNNLSELEILHTYKEEDIKATDEKEIKKFDENNLSELEILHTYKTEDIKATDKKEIKKFDENNLSELEILHTYKEEENSDNISYSNENDDFSTFFVSNLINLENELNVLIENLDKSTEINDTQSSKCQGIDNLGYEDSTETSNHHKTDDNTKKRDTQSSKYQGIDNLGYEDSTETSNHHKTDDSVKTHIPEHQNDNKNLKKTSISYNDENKKNKKGFGFKSLFKNFN